MKAGSIRKIKRATVRRGASLVRSLLVGGSTMAILVVVFAIYQMTQPAVEPRQPRKQIEKPAPVRERIPRPEPIKAEEGVDIGGVTLQQGKAIKFSVYPPEGDRAIAEISLQGWTPRQGTPNAFDVVGPEVRLLTRTGHGVKAVAREGVLETRGRLGTNPDVRRGRLVGDVVIEIDRLSESDRMKLPEEIRTKIDPSQIVRIETDEVSFDYEFARIVIPGEVRLKASDAEAVTSDVEIRFNETAGRVEYCRIGAGGYIEVLQAYVGVGLSEAGLAGGGSDDRQSVTDWMGQIVRAAVEAGDDLAPRVAEGTQDGPPAQAGTGRSGPSDEGGAHAAAGDKPASLPVFKLDDSDEEDEEDADIDRAVRYHARFEGDVHVTQSSGDQNTSTLVADMLAVLRDFTPRERDRMRQAAQGDSSENKARRGGPTVPAVTGDTDDTGDARNGDAGGDPARNVMRVQWKDRLAINAVVPDNEAEFGTTPNVTAVGEPVRLSGRQGRASCRRLTFEPQGSDVTLVGTDDDPASVDLQGQGTLRGGRIRFTQGDGRFAIYVAGPGALDQTAAMALNQAGSAPGDHSSGNGAASAPARGIAFEGTLQAHGRIVRENIVSLTGMIRRRTVRVLDRAEIEGRSTIRDGDTDLSADQLDVRFGTDKTVNGLQQGYERLIGEGDVVMNQGSDRLRCERIDVDLTTIDGKPAPRAAVAEGRIVVSQGRREVRCNERLEAGFGLVVRPPGPFDPVKAYRRAVQGGTDPSAFDLEAARRAHGARTEKEAAINRIHAVGDVFIDDPDQRLELRASRVTCAIEDGRDISKAQIEGDGDKEASLTIDDLTVRGRRIDLDGKSMDARVDGSGTMTIMSRKDLDGSRVDKPVPINIAWGREMTYRDAAGEARFSGGVHASSRSNSSFDCAEMQVLFAEVAEGRAGPAARRDWWLLEDLVPALRAETGGAAPLRRSFRKEPSRLIATGQARALTWEPDAATGGLESRAMIEGNRMTVDLVEGDAKLVIDGAGSLLLEDFRPAPPSASATTSASTEQTQQGLAVLDVDSSSGPSKTPIYWKRQMTYDFASRRATFDGEVQLKHFSGRKLQEIFGSDATKSVTGPSVGQPVPPGRSTYLDCGRLVVTFQDDGSSPSADAERLGGMSAGSIHSFQAERDVRVVDETEAVVIHGHRVRFQRATNTITVEGDGARSAVFIRQPAGELPQRVDTNRFEFNVRTRELSVSKFTFEGRN